MEEKKQRTHNHYGKPLDMLAHSNYEQDHSHSHCYDTQEGHEKHLHCCICTKGNHHTDKEECSV